MSISLIPSKEELSSLQLVAKSASNSKFFQSLGGEEGLFTLMLYAKELGISPMQAIMGGINIIQGKAEVAPRLMNALIRQKGHKLNIRKSTEQICEIEGERADTKEKYIAIYTIEEAKRSGLVRGEHSPWNKYPSDMLFKSCLSRLARRLFPDVVLTSYIEGEIQSAPVETVIVEEEKISAEQVIQLDQLLKEIPEEAVTTSFLAWSKIEKLEDLPANKFDLAMKALLKKKESSIQKEVVNV